MVIRHMDPTIPFFVTSYQNVKHPMIAVRDFVKEGHCIALIGNNDGLHFEIRQIVNTQSRSDWEDDNTEPIDPLPFLYRWEKIHFEEYDASGTTVRERSLLRSASVIMKEGVWAFEVEHSGSFPIIPLYSLDEIDRRLIALLQDACMHQKIVRLHTRESPLFGGRQIITAAYVLGES